MRTVQNVYPEEVGLNGIKFQRRARVVTRDERKDRPSTFRTEESMVVIQKCLFEDRNLSVRKL
jgi:hypothetical protein